VALVIAAYLDDAEVNLPEMSIRLTVSNLLNLDEIKHACDVIRDVCGELFGLQDEDKKDV